VADGAEAIRILKGAFPDALLATGEFRDQHWAELRPDRLVDVGRFLRDDPALRFALLLDVTASHWPDEDPPMTVVYHLYSFDRKDRLRLKVRTADRGPVPTLTGVWKSADWNERECYDMFGIVFEGHPDLRRILMPDDYTEHPLRRELPLFRG
jgi:NADH-quinone oxidoreductase subunit C